MAEASISSTSSVKTRKADEQKRNIAMIGHVSNQVAGAKLPSNRQVLKVFFYNMRFVNLSAKESAALTIDAECSFSGNRHAFQHVEKINVRTKYIKCMKIGKC